MFEICITPEQINEVGIRGYRWSCPLCVVKLDRDLSSAFIAVEAVKHMVGVHKADVNCIGMIEYVEVT